MRVLVSGSTGLIGRFLVNVLSREGHTVVPLTRGGGASSGIVWDPATGAAPFDGDGFDAVIHLAGENIAGGRWTASRKERIRTSRVHGTRLLAEAAGRASHPPSVFLCASAVGFYGDRGDAVLTEESGPGEGFLPEVCVAWESAAEPARAAGIRVVHARFGIVLSPAGGALAKMLSPFRWGLGGPIGHGRQYWSWVSLDDAVGALVHVLRTPGLAGPVNVVSPSPVTNAQFTRDLSRILKRPAVLPMPGPMARLLLGEMAEALLLSSARVEPRRLLSTGFAFSHPNLPSALSALLPR